MKKNINFTYRSILIVLFLVVNGCTTAPEPSENVTKAQKPLPALTPREELLIAVMEGSASKVIKWISKGADVNARRKDYATPLLIASKKGDIEMVKVLLAEGADIQDSMPYYIPPLYYFEAYRTDGTVIPPAEHAERRKVHITSLGYASEAGSIELVKLLVNNGAKVETKHRPTPVQYAIRHGHKVIEEFLVSHKAVTNWGGSMHISVLTNSRNGVGITKVVNDLNNETSILKGYPGKLKSLHNVVIIKQTPNEGGTRVYAVSTFVKGKHWSPNADLSLSDVSYIILSPGEYSIHVSYSDGRCVSSDRILLNLNAVAGKVYSVDHAKMNMKKCSEYNNYTGKYSQDWKPSIKSSILNKEEKQLLSLQPK